jgi:hypothetical protein
MIVRNVCMKMYINRRSADQSDSKDTNNNRDAGNGGNTKEKQHARSKIVTFYGI